MASPLDIQRALIARGYDVGPSGADGVMGRATIAAVKKLQKDKGLTVDGIVGEKTRGALGLAQPPAGTADAPPTRGQRGV
jgi:peptidoglycan hydrolase-like protein with peptidoglycan-binding domain